MDLFDAQAQKESLLRAPLAERMRPKTLEEFVGQTHILGSGHFLRMALENDEIPSLILWGPPGTGKTTLASVLAQKTRAEFLSISAVLGGVAQIRDAITRAIEVWKHHRRKTLLFVDEIHRFNKAQQDALLPHVEKGTVTLIGATTENPSFEVNAALLSRCRVITLKALEEEDLLALLRRALESPKGLSGKARATDEALLHLARSSGGDARRALTSLEVAAQHASGDIDLSSAQEALQTKTLLYDKQGEEHHNVVSAFIKSMRGSDVDAAIYWMTRMLESGEEPHFILRRMLIFASEDIGNADPQALQVALHAFQAFLMVGLPEGALVMTQAVTYLALAPKSNTVLRSYAAAKEAVEKHGPLPVPLHIRNAPTGLMKNLGYGVGYAYPHEFEGHVVAAHYLPDALRPSNFYQPSPNGLEAEWSQRWQRIKSRLPKREPGEEG